MEYEGSIQCSLEPAIGTYRKSDKTSPQRYFSKICFNILFPPKHRSPSDLFLKDFQLELCMNISSVL